LSKRVLASGVVEGGKLMLSRRTHFDDSVAREFKEGARVMVTVEKSTRTSRQNALLWFWNTIIAKDLGWDAEEVHEYDKGRIQLVHKTRIDRKTGEVIDVAIPRGTHDMSVDLFSEMMEEKQRLWAEEGIVLPSPNNEEY
jgi:hypothetical protein